MKKLKNLLPTSTIKIIYYMYKKQALSQGSVLRKVHKVNQFNQEARLKVCIFWNNYGK